MLKKMGKTFNLSEGLTPLIKRHKEEGLGRKSLKLHQVLGQFGPDQSGVFKPNLSASRGVPCLTKLKLHWYSAALHHWLRRVHDHERNVGFRGSC